MCIRDRPDGPHNAVIAALRVGVREHSGDGVVEVPPPRIDAVSYTHLRAHETVLDLVCRLLLEKKKNHRFYHHTRDMLNSYYKTSRWCALAHVPHSE